MSNQGSETLRELLRILVRNLGILEKSDALCCGVTISQCHAIVEIGRAEKISLIDLAELLELDKSTMSRTINNLVDAEIVKRETNSENRRYISIQLTDKGAAVFKNIEDNMFTYYAGIFNTIPEDKRNQVLDSLQILVQSVRDNN
ncbi:MarR family winged helix-turn-helix transcriptional regulator [Anaerocolumna sp. MB42-C2]|uniref:MarR family winged helix-turn-helix transcriptional regulator n=1 Tax=Anaerocolumna sp. MB42-C2 TaxID=3070997 RepID=UPI0027E0B2BF|nr:MarR family transcriptional regulator [Anaerocolumna sp. MB42-C2]WMJ88218.1 MarR family transcriptional regulator [Anaerocolumna sp. MB42-C2]